MSTPDYISEFIEGPTMQDLDRQAIEALLPVTLQVQQTIAATDIAHTSGYGEFDLSGNGKSSSWQEWLLTHISLPDFDWRALVAKGIIEQNFLDKVFDAFKRLVDQVPNERKLIHGDFGSNNVLTRNGKIVAAIDWDAASYGDWLFDVAGAYYWSDHLLCMRLAAAYYERALSRLPDYRARINCYQIRAALTEIYEHAHRREQEELRWHVERCQKVLEEL